MTSLLLIRHGETDWNIEGRYQGQADPPLNAKGVAQAHVIAEELSGARVAVLYSSPLRRARQTAEILARSFALPLYIEPRLMEIHQGDWQTRLRSEITALYPDLFHRWETEPWQVNPPGGEPLTQVQERVYAAVDDLVSRHQGHSIGLVTHRIPILLLKIRFQGLDPDAVRTAQLPNTFWEIIPLDDAQSADRSVPD